MNSTLLDFESRSIVDLRKHGVHRYSSDPSTEILCCAFKVNTEHPVIWFPKLYETGLRETKTLLGCTMHRVIDDDEAKQIIADANTLSAHNAQFERLMFQEILHKRFGWPAIPLSKFRCTAARAAALALPRSLEMVGRALNLPVQKDKEGRKLMLRMSKPQPDGRYVEDIPSLIRLGQYCVQDVESEYAVKQALPPLPESEEKIWQLDQRINDRGIGFDREGALALKWAIEGAEIRLLKQVDELTNGTITSARQVKALRDWLKEEEDLDLDDLKKGTVKDALAKLPDGKAKQMLQIRQEMSLSSTAKINAALTLISPDDRIRGTLLYHGASTGRWGGKGFQPHNLPRDSYKDPQDVQDAIDGFHVESTIKAASKCLRGLIVPQGGRRIWAVDYSAIEARTLAWLADEQSALDVFRRGLDPYKVVATQIYKVPYDQVTKEQRNNSKVPELSCIAEGQLVLTDHGLIPIEQVTLEQKVWDGLAFVSHDGVLCHGIREVMQYENLVATKEHLVWTTGSDRPIPFEQAATSGKNLLQSGAGRQEIWLGGNYLAGTQVHETRLATSVCSGSVHRMRERAMDVHGKSFSREEQRMPEMFSTASGTPLANEASQCDEITLRKREGSRLQKLRRPRNQVPIPFIDSRQCMDSGESRSETRTGIGSDRQQRALRTRQFEVQHSLREQSKYASSHSHRGAGSLGVYDEPFVSLHDSSLSASRLRRGSNHRHSDESGHREAQELAGHSGTPLRVRVYDIINAGPRHRFTVSNVLVHNCGYSGWVPAFNAMAVNLGVEPIPEERAKEIILAWRANRPMTVAFWHGLEDAAKQAVRTGKPYRCGKILFGVKGDFLFMKLPSGRMLAYPYPEIQERTDSFGRTREVVTFMGDDPYTHKWTRLYTYGGRLAENSSSGVARDVLCDGAVKLDAAGYDIVLTVHDEIVGEDDQDRVEKIRKQMIQMPPWAEDLPMEAEGYISTRYRK